MDMKQMNHMPCHSGEASFGVLDVDPPLTWVARQPDNLIYCRCLWTQCYATFRQPEELEQHVRAHTRAVPADDYPSISAGLPCPIHRCERILASASHLQRHICMHIFHFLRQFSGLNAIMNRDEVAHLLSCGFHPSSGIVYDGAVMRCEWDTCTAFFDDIIFFISHITEHINALGTEDRSPKFQFHCYWKDCGMSFKNKANLRIHIRHHSGDKVTACPYCGVFFSNNSKLFDHILRRASSKSTFGDQEKYSCNLCQKEFETQRLLREHCRRHIMNHKCDYCIVTVDSPSALQRHISAVHAKQRTHKCQFCGHSFSQKADLDRHEIIHTNELEHKCEQCNEQFRWKKQLTAHLRKHDANYKPYTHLCHICDAKYTNGYGLSRHLVRRHKCSVPKGFSRFQYKKCKDGFARLQTRRCLSRSLAEELGFGVRDGGGDVSEST